ncbi:MAG: Arm DNA-binding domain-containing protein [Caulobacterales bacterium]
MITEAAIKSAIRKKPASGKTITLTDDGARGEGRLVLQVRGPGERVIAEWYAAFYKDGSRKLAKIGAYPVTSLADARKLFREQFAPAISKGETPKGKRALTREERAGRTVLDLFTAYCDHLDDTGKRSREARILLLGSSRKPTGKHAGVRTQSAAAALGPTKLACAVEPASIRAHLQRIHARGSVCSCASRAQGQCRCVGRLLVGNSRIGRIVVTRGQS